ncbi:DUF6221 family protein [Nonomuraea typhae]|uniref:DUF6221 family protein n=1 Tax=Nonomuraea typhae TaxID=2603600 RepID=UPI001C7227CC
MDDLIAFLRARLDDEERTARAATPGPWRVDPDRLLSGLHRVVTADCIEGPTAGHEHGSVVVAGDDVGGTASCDAQHIVLHDPARVLREVEAKRQLLDQFRLRGDSVRRTVQPATGGVWDDLLRLLALPYADHPEFREQWKR